MTLIEWKDEFATGIPDVDLEHRQLIKLINELHQATAGTQADYPVPAFLGEIYAHVAAHFALEEKIMREHNYDRYREHKSDHERLLDELRDIMDDYEEHAYFDDAEFTGHINRWFVEHFRTHDARLHRHIGS